MKQFFIVASFLFIGCQADQESNPFLSTGEAFVEVEGGKVWIGILGEGTNTPYLCLHGGPGGTSRSKLLMSDLAEERPIILMDQLGGGLSTYHEDTTLLTVAHFVEQVRAVKESLNLKEFFLSGSSWGTALALEYYSAYPEGVKGIVFNSPYFSTSTWIADTDTLIATLPDSIQQIIRVAEETNAFDTKAYKAAEAVFFKHFLIRTDRSTLPPPSYVAINPAYDEKPIAGNRFIYLYMWGPSEFSPTGTLLDYENTDALSQVKVPVLFTTGEYDEARPVTVKKYASMVANSEYVEIPGAGHGTIIDNTEAVVRAHRDFANRVDESH